MQEPRFRPVTDIGIRVPADLPQPVDPALQEIVHRLSGVLRAETVALAQREIAREPASRLTIVLSLMKSLVFGRAAQTVQDVLDGETPVACGSGCTACCYRPVEATIPEAILIALGLIDSDDPRCQQILDAADGFKSQSALERRRSGRPCPLLVGGACSVYDDRPLMCRSVMSPDAEGCRASLLSVLAGRDELPVSYFVAAQYFICGDVAALQGICRDLGLQHDLVDLVQMLAAILRDPGIIDRWLAGERVFPAEPGAPL